MVLFIIFRAQAQLFFSNGEKGFASLILSCLCIFQNCDKEKQAGYNLQQAGKKHRELFETSEFSESCDLPPPAENLLRCSEKHQNKGSNCAVTSMPEVHAEALTAGSYAEILLALSQASVKCSLQEPLCSFVPCSVNAKRRSSANEPTKCNVPESNNETTVKHAESMVNGLTSGRPCDNWNMLGTSPTRGVKRMHSNSLQRYSTNTLSPLVEAMMQTTEKQLSKKIKDTKETSGVNFDQTDRTVKADVPSNKGALSGQCELILQDSGLQDSPPLIWHRGKRRRLRACRVAESELTECKGDDSTCGLLNVDSAIAKVFLEPGI